MVENISDELWLGVKDQSNLEIAGSPRNSFRASLVLRAVVVELWMDWEPYRSPKPNKLRMLLFRSTGVSPRGISFADERETTQTVS